MYQKVILKLLNQQLFVFGSSDVKINFDQTIQNFKWVFIFLENLTNSSTKSQNSKLNDSSYDNLNSDTKCINDSLISDDSTDKPIVINIEEEDNSQLRQQRITTSTPRTDTNYKSSLYENTKNSINSVSLHEDNYNSSQPFLSIKNQEFNSNDEEAHFSESNSSKNNLNYQRSTSESKSSNFHFNDSNDHNSSSNDTNLGMFTFLGFEFIAEMCNRLENLTIAITITWINFGLILIGYN